MHARGTTKGNTALDWARKYNHGSREDVMILLNHADSRTAEDSLVARERAVERESERSRKSVDASCHQRLKWSQKVNPSDRPAHAAAGAARA